MSRRTVTTVLELITNQYRKKIGEVEDDTRSAADAVDELGDKGADAFDRVGKSSDKASTGLKKAGKQAGELRKQFLETQIRLKDLVAEFDKTGDITLFDKMRKDRSLLNQLTRARKDIGDLGSSVTSSLGDALRGLPSELKGAAIIGAVGLGAILAPHIGAAVGAGVLGATGGVGILGGILAASRDVRVKEAAAQMGGRLGDTLQASIGEKWIAPVIYGLDRIEAMATSALSDLAPEINKLAGLIKPLADGLDGMVDALKPGLADAMEAAQPIVRALANELPEIGEAISDMLTSISEESDGAILALVEMLHIIEDMIFFTGKFIAGMSAAFEWMVRTGNAATEWGQKWLGWMPLVGKGSELLNAETDSLLESLDEAKNGTDDWTGALDLNAKAARQAAAELDEYKNAIDDLFDKQISIIDAQIGYQEAIDNTTKALKEGKRTLDINSAAGRENMDAIVAQIKAIERVRDANIANNMTVDDANRLAGQQLEALRKTLLQLGYNEKAVNDLINSFKGIPAQASTKVTAPGLVDSQNRLRKVEDLLNRLDGRVTTNYVRTIFGEYRAGERNPTGRRWGGITEYAQDGLLREAGVYSARFPARYAFAEPATRGEAFIPKSGDYGRSMAILSQAARWYGASVVPGGSTSSAVASPAIAPDVLGRAVRAALQGMTVVMDGRAVGELTGRTADRYQRGG